ncbi:Fpg/Nei family DNA glycosylase [Brevibacterium sp. BRM-1]|uniref:Fpg/Nei family DNA glycosylase n=1 Tax=Brevibacterium sp. BRM-1 TaxID=2999062 RepID=UPI00227F756E|nr:DNA-formamidopyrimidine glycosylase family protein [Brevibacterium sp. BRM-1]WAL40703.1 Fpg/Nei family DNA glycosylase [Brevibacterium sp. BRM-1]
MPEGHSVHRIARRFDELFAGQPVRVTSPQGRFAAGAQRLDGRTVLRTIAVGKQMFMEFDGDLWLRVHLGIYGAWDFALRAGAGPDEVGADARGAAARAADTAGADARGGDAVGAPHGGAADPGERGSTERIGQTGEYSLPARALDARRARVERPASMGAPRRLRAGESETELPGASGAGRGELEQEWPPEPIGAVRVRLLGAGACADLRGPTACEVLDAAQVDAVLAKLGPDPLVDGRARGRRRFAAAVAKRRTPIGTLLMDQAVIAGIGNIYRAEMLFRAGISPFAPGSALSAEQVDALWDDWAKLLPIGVDTGVIVTRTGLRGRAKEAALEHREERHWVYGRAGQPCRVCGTPIAMELMQNRKLFWCPVCQQR